MNKIKAVITDSRNADVQARRYRFEPLYSGGAAFIDDFDAPVYIDLSTLRIDPAPKALLEHDMEQVVGKLENIEINGTVEGLPGEAAQWGIPSVIALGDFAANKENSFSIEFDAPQGAEIVHNLKDVVITPQHVKQGRNTLNIKTSNMRDNTILFGEMLIKTDVSRRIYITGKAKKGAPEHTSIPPVSGELTISAPLQIDPPDEVIAPIVPDDEQINLVRKGQRVSLGQLSTRTLKIVYSHKSEHRPLAVDPYVFLLGKNGKVRADNDLVFFGNEESQGHEVRVKTDTGNAFATIELSKISEDIEKIAVCMSVYDDQSGTDFSCVDDPVIRIFSDDNLRSKLRCSPSLLTPLVTIRLSYCLFFAFCASNGSTFSIALI